MLYKDRKIFIFIFTKIKMTTFNSYNDVIAYVEKRIPVLFGEVFRSSDLANCSSQMQLILNQNFTNKGTIKKCRINMTANQESSTDALCVDVNDKLKSLSTEERKRMFDDVLNKLFSEPVFVNNLENRKNFRTEFIEKLKDELHNISPSAQVSCNSNILVVQNQEVVNIGTIECDPESSINLDSTAVAYQQMKCLTVPVLDKLKRNNLLYQLFNKGDNQDCIYQLDQIQPCRLVNGKLQRDYQVTIIQNKIGNGKCIIKEQNLGFSNQNILTSGQVFTESCPPPPDCKASEWNEWTPCYDVKNADGSVKKMQYRTRQIIQQGANCPKNLKEERTCIPLTSLANSGMFASVGEIITEKKEREKLPWYFNILFIIILLFFSYLFVKDFLSKWKRVE